MQESRLLSLNFNVSVGYAKGTSVTLTTQNQRATVHATSTYTCLLDITMQT